MPTELFRATTLSPDMWGLQEPLVERPRILEILNRHPQTDTVTWMVGPVGSGKTSAGLQWAHSFGTDVQYASATPPRDLTPDSQRKDPDDFGLALQELLNVCSRLNPDAPKEAISEHLERVISLSQEKPGPFVLDDLQQIHRSNMNTLIELFGNALPRLRADRALFISRTMDSSVLGGLQAINSLRMVLPETLAFDRKEASAAQKQGVFGTATPQQVETARDESQGWISGMLVSLHGHGGRTLSRESFRSMLINELLMDQPPPILQIMVASANLPFNHREIWELWYDRFDIPHYLIPAMAAQLPASEECLPLGRIDLAPVMADALRNVRGITVSREALRELLPTALSWYIEHHEIEAAVQLSEEHNLHAELLRGLKHLYTPAAEVENWSEIRKGTCQIPEDILSQDSDLTFWYFHAAVENDEWPIMRRLYDRISTHWRDSPDPVTRGRAHLVDAWNAYMLNEADKVVESCMSAYETFPESSRRERMWTAGTASIANSLRGNRPEARRWSALANFEATFTHSPSRWWHNNASPIRYSWMAIAGLMKEAGAVAGQKIRAVEELSPKSATRYRLLQAQIEIERLNLDTAEALVDEAGTSLDDYYSQHHFYRLVRANLARVKGEYAAAKDLLTNVKTPTLQRFDQFAREMFASASIALDEADLDSAEFFLNCVTPGDRAWPKFFGDVNPELIRSMLLYARGNVEEAISVAQATLQAAQKRSHLYYVVRAHAIMAYIYHHTQQPARWRDSMQKAVAAAGDSGYQLAFLVRTEDVRKLGEIPITATQSHDVNVARNNIAHRISAREIEVLSMVAQSFSNKRIADELFISVSTVKNHLASVYDKLGTNNRREAVQMAKQIGLIS